MKQLCLTQHKNVPLGACSNPLLSLRISFMPKSLYDTEFGVIKDYIYEDTQEVITNGKRRVR